MELGNPGAVVADRDPDPGALFVVDLVEPDLDLAVRAAAQAIA